MANWLNLWEDYKHFNFEVSDEERKAWNKDHASEVEEMFAVSN